MIAHQGVANDGVNKIGSPEILASVVEILGLRIVSVPTQVTDWSRHSRLPWPEVFKPFFGAISG